MFTPKYTDKIIFIYESRSSAAQSNISNKNFKYFIQYIQIYLFLSSQLTVKTAKKKHVNPLDHRTSAV